MRVNEPLWSVEDVAAYFGVSMRTLYDWRARGYGPHAKKMGPLPALRPRRGPPLARVP